MRWAIVLAGGSGTRFWPLSTPERPKQLLALAGPSSTAEETIARLDGLVPRERVLVVTGPALAPLLQQALGLPAANLLVEPRAASTGPALVWGTWEAKRRDPEADVLALHADWAVGQAAAFRRVAAEALRVARAHHRLVTVGIIPTRPETGYGYIVPGAPLEGEARTVERFVEKPDATAALDLMAEGALWNSGLFAWTADDLLAEIRRNTPEIAPHLARLDAGDVAGFFRDVRSVSIDVGLLERSASIAVLPGAFSWDDVGTWEALSRVRPLDANGNVTEGPVFLHASRDCVAWTDAEPVVLVGVHDLVVVRANERVLVMHRSQAAHLKDVLDKLPAEVREVHS
ncbi:MAG: mannose-1-phosphate guanylyltransferase [Gemmatimonadota bacterium]